MQDIWEYARGRVGNKGVLARIGHSSKLHSFRSATRSKGSAGSKALGLLGAGARAALNAIPVPALGGILGAVQQKVEGEIRAWHHKKRGESSDFGEQVKFSLKELSVEEMDRYRNKVSMAVEDLNKAMARFPDRVAKKRAQHATCDAYLELAEAGEQASRRLLLLRQGCFGLTTAMAMTVQWANEVQFGWPPSNTPPAPPPPQKPISADSVTGKKNAVSKLLKDEIEAELALAKKADETMQTGMAEAFILEYHGKCGQWCCFREAGKPDNWATFKNNAAQVTRFLSEPFGLEDLIGNVQDNVGDDS